MKFIDLHTHIAYNIDDGAKSIGETKEMLKQASIQGYTGMCMTPHIDKETASLDYYHLVNDRFNELKELASSYNIKIYIGNEIKLDEHTMSILNDNLFYPLNHSRYILIECDLSQPYHHIFDYLEDYLNLILLKGYIPIIAHVERYYKDEIDLDYIDYLRQKGCLIQINTTSIINKYKKVKTLLDYHYADIISSDAHDPHKRNINMLDAYKILVKKGYNHEYLEDIMYNHADMIIHNKDVVRKKYKKRNLIRKILSAK